MPGTDDGNQRCISSAPQAFSGVPRQVLRLQDHVPRELCFDVTNVNFQLGMSLDDVLPLFRADSWVLPRQFPADLCLHPTAEIFRHLAALPLPTGHTASDGSWERIDVFTDGSFDGKCSSWAFLVVGWAVGHVHVIGWSAGPVEVSLDAELFVGAGTHDALRGEVSALFSWLLQGPKLAVVFVWSDCLVALKQTNGSYGSQADDCLSQHVRALFQALQASGVQVADIGHVRSHMGHPANECVDGFARWACGRRAYPRSEAQVPFASAARSGRLEWWWLLLDSVSNPRLWPQHAGRDFIFRCCSPVGGGKPSLVGPSGPCKCSFW